MNVLQFAVPWPVIEEEFNWSLGEPKEALFVQIGFSIIPAHCAFMLYYQTCK